MIGAGLLAVLVAAPARAQESRAAEIEKAQQEKAAHLEPYRPNKAEAVLTALQDTLILAPNGFYPVFGSAYSGGGFTLGAGYRRYLGDRLNWNVRGLYSVKNYSLLEVALHSPRPLTGRLDFTVVAGRRDAPQVSYHGLGIDSPTAETRYRMEQGYAGGDAWFRPLPWTVLHAGLRVEQFTISDGQGHAPDVDDVFTPATAPGLGDSPDFVHGTLTAAIDTRPSPEYARRGGLYEIAFHQYTDPDGTYTFDRIESEAVQHIPLVRENWVISLRGRLHTTVGDGDVVPFFMLPSLGSGSTLRGYSSWRFRDRHSMLFAAEWRWLPNRMAMDAALFFDAGTVSSTFSGLGAARLQSDFGIGVRFHSPVATPLRIDVAYGREGVKLNFAASAAF